MSDCSPQSLMDSAACFACRTEEEKSTLELALLYAWSESTQTVQELMDSAACFNCRTAEEKSTLETQLLCEILNAEPPAGCVEVTDATIYSGGTQDPQLIPWSITGGTATTVGFDVQVTGTITEIYVSVNFPGALDGTFDLTPVAGCLELFAGDEAPITAIDITGLTSLTSLQLNACSIVSFTAQSCPTLTSFGLYATNSVTDIDMSGFPALVTASISVNPLLTTVDITGCVALLNVAGFSNALDQATVDHILTTLDSNGLSNGTCDLSLGTSSAPGAGGAAAAANLIGKGWTVTTN